MRLCERVAVGVGWDQPLLPLAAGGFARLSPRLKSLAAYAPRACPNAGR